jgi:hypothetical protein
MKLLDQVRHTLRVKHFSYRTEQAYLHWIERYIRHHGIRHPNTMGAAEAEQVLDAPCRRRSRCGEHTEPSARRPVVP